MARSLAIETIFSAVDKITRPTKAIRKRFQRLGKTAERTSKRLASTGNILKGILGAKIIQFGFQKIAQGLSGIIKSAVKVEDAVAAFQPLLGSLEKSEELVARLNKEAATTPFQFEGIADVAKKLLPVMNGSIEDTAATFRMLGDTAGGKIAKLTTITNGYSKALLKGKPDLESLNMIGEAGVPIFTEMAKTMGISVKELFKLSKQGKLTNKDLTQTFKNMTSEGGIFFKGMEIASRTFSGKMSTLKDNISLTGAALGSALLPQLKSGVDLLIKITSKVREFISANKEVIQSRLDAFIKKIKGPLSSLMNVFKILATSVLPALKQPFMALVNLVTLLFSGIKKLFVLMEQSGFLKDVFTGIASALTMIINLVTQVVKQIMSLGQSQGMFKAISGVIKQLVAVFVVFMEVINSIWTTLQNIGAIKAIINIFTIFLNLLKISFKILKPLLKIVGFLIKAVLIILSPIIKLVSGVSGLLAKITGFFAGIGDKKPKPGPGDNPRSTQSRLSGDGLNMNTTETRTTESKVSIDFNNLPESANIKTKGGFEGINLDTGKQR